MCEGSQPVRVWARPVRRSPRAAVPRTVALALVLGALGATAGVAYGDRKERSFEATAVILLNPTEGNPFSPDGTAGADLVNLQTEAELVASDEVGRIVRDRRGGDSTAAELADVSAAVPANTQLIEITVADRSADQAADRAQAFAEVFLAYRRSRSEAAVFDRSAAIDEQIEKQSDQLDEHVLALAEARRSSPDAILLKQQIIEATTHLAQLRSQGAGIDAAPIDPGQVVTPAAASPAGPLGTRVLGGLLGLAVGLGAGIAWGVSRVRLAGWIRGPDDLPDTAPQALATLSLPKPTDEELGRLRAGVLARSERRPLVILATALEGDPVTANPLAVSLARANLEVVLVEVSSAEAEDYAEPGLVDVLRGTVDADRVLEPRTGHLNVVRPGTEPAALEDLVVAPEMGLLVEDLRKRADVVIIAGAESGGSRASALARHADLVLVEIAVGSATVDDITATLSALGHGESAANAALVLLRHPRGR